MLVLEHRARIDEEFLYGRGAIDDKGPVIYQ